MGFDTILRGVVVKKYIFFLIKEILNACICTSNVEAREKVVNHVQEERLRLFDKIIKLEKFNLSYFFWKKCLYQLHYWRMFNYCLLAV